MNKIITQLPEIKLVGITTRTSNAAEFNPDTAKIKSMLQRFFADNLQDKILNKKIPVKFLQFIQITIAMKMENIPIFWVKRLLLLKMLVKDLKS